MGGPLRILYNTSRGRGVGGPLRAPFCIRRGSGVWGGHSASPTISRDKLQNNVKLSKPDGDFGFSHFPWQGADTSGIPVESASGLLGSTSAELVSFAGTPAFASGFVASSCSDR